MNMCSRYIFIIQFYLFISTGCISFESNDSTENERSVKKLVEKISGQAKHVLVYHDGCHADNDVLKYLMGSNISITIKNNNINTLEKKYLLIITESIAKLCSSTFLFDKNNTMTYKVNMIIYDKGRHNSVHLLNSLSRFFRQANVFYVHRSLFYSLSSPLLPDREFINMKSRNFESFRTQMKKLPDMKKNLVRLLTYNSPIYLMVDESKKNIKERYYGIEMQIIMEIAKKMNFLYKIELVDMKDGWVGIYQNIKEGNADVGFGGLWKKKDGLVIYSLPWTEVGMGFLVPRPKLDNRSWMNIVKPFSLELWLFNIIALLVTPMVLWYLLMLSNSLKDNLTRGNILKLASSYLYMFGGFCQVSSQLSSRKEMVIRYLFLSWNIFVLMMATAYSSCIIARLTSPSYTTTIDTTKQLVQLGMKWGKLFPVADMSTVINLNNEWNKQFAARYKIYTQSEISKMIKANSMAVYCKLLDTYNVFYTNHIDEEDLLKLRIMKERVIMHELAFVFQKNSPLTPVFNRMIIRLFESGITTYWKKHFGLKYSNASNLQLFNDVINHSDELKPLSMSNLMGAFYILIFGLSAASICFLLEVAYNRNKLPIPFKN